jgi:hypothetical protein
MQPRALAILGGAFLMVLVFGGSHTARLGAKDKTPQVSADDPTLRLFDLLDTKFGGKLDNFYVVADSFNDPQNPEHALQHILRLDYEKGRNFGKLRFYVRTVDKLSPEQLKTYTPKEIFEFAESDSEKFSKMDPGPFGRTGDVYFLPTSPGGPLGSSPITDEVQARYDRYVTQYILPALEKKLAGGSGS